MSKEYCEDCGRELDLAISDHESCSDCGNAQFCRVCADALKERTFHPDVSECEMIHDE